MKKASVELSREELRSLYFFHKDIAEDTEFACKTDHSEKIAADRLRRANKFKKVLKRKFRYDIEKEEKRADD